MSNNGDEIQGGAATLMGLFQPPPPPNDDDDEKAKKNEAAQQLMNLFQPPPDENESSKLLLPSPDDDDGAQGASKLMSLFQPPTPPHDHNNNNATQETPQRTNAAHAQNLRDLFPQPAAKPLAQLKPELERQSTERTGNGNQSYPLLEDSWGRRDSWEEATPQACNSTKRLYDSIPAPPLHERMGSIKEDSIFLTDTSRLARLRNFVIGFSNEHLTTSTFLGGFIFLLYHIVFCLAMGSTISRGNLGVMTKMAASGVIFVSPIYIHFLGNEIPAQYPTTDLFLAPFLAKLAVIVTDTLAADDNYTDGDESSHVFLSTFCVLTSIGMMGSGVLILLATTFKLANLGSFLPFPVLCGFFSAVGVILWTLALGVDTGGKTVAQVLSSGEAFLNAVVHHGPSLITGTIMKIYGPSNPFFSSYVIAATIVSTYAVMFFTNTSLEDAREAGWFWTHHDLMPPSNNDQWLPPAPFGVVFGLRHVHWGAVYNGLQTAMALSFLYALRCSLHATALKKNVANLKRIETQSVVVRTKGIRDHPHKHRRRWTEEVDIEEVQNSHKDESTTLTNTVVVAAKIPTVSLQHVLVQYSYGQFLSAALGSFGVTPAVAAMGTMYKLGAEGRGPQYMSLLLLLIFYVTDFRLVAFIPKMSFSCLIVLSCLDMVVTWFVDSYYKTMEKMEWLVVPVIVVSAFVVGLLNSVFVGIAISTFIFVAAFFRSGVVKYLANGLTIRSTIERSFDASQWLDLHGDKIQLVVLQNYLFFGNASSMLSYISTMFEDVPPSEELLEYDLPPLPKYIILDLTLVTGMDTSTVDVFNDIKTICNNHGAKLFVAGLSVPLRATLALGNFKPERGERSKRNVRFFAALDTAIGKAEDCLLDNEMINTDRSTLDVFNVQDEAASFERALKAIDEQHGTDFSMDLMDLYQYTTPIELEQGDHLYSCEGGPIPECDRGLTFIASGLLKIERDSNMSLTRNCTTANSGGQSLMWNSKNSLSNLQARGSTMGKQAALLKSGAQHRTVESFVRLARVGPGWVAGTLESVQHSVGATQFPNHQVAVSKCKVHHLAYHKIEEIEDKDPKLVLQLYKVLSHLMARRQEITIGQLMTLHSIMTSPAAGKPMGRLDSHRGSSFQ